MGAYHPCGGSMNEDAWFIRNRDRYRPFGRRPFGGGISLPNPSSTPFPFRLWSRFRQEEHTSILTVHANNDDDVILRHLNRRGELRPIQSGAGKILELGCNSRILLGRLRVYCICLGTINIAEIRKCAVLCYVEGSVCATPLDCHREEARQSDP